MTASQLLGSPLYYINQDWYNSWIAFTKQSFGLLTMTMTQTWAPTIVRMSGDRSVRGEISQDDEGNIKCDFAERCVMMGNHQIYTDWLYLWWVAYTNNMHGRMYIVLKESLRKIPVLGWGMQVSQFIFLKRDWEQDKPNMSKHLQKLSIRSNPMWLLIFPEGTNLAPSTRERSAKWAKKMGINDLQHTLLPRSTGLQFCLQQLRSTTDYVYDCTMAYEGVPRGQFAQDIFTVSSAYLQGKPPKSVNMHWRKFAVKSMPLDNDRAFELWLRARWMEKDALIEYWYKHGHFPADRGVDKGPNGRRRAAGLVESEIKAFRWYEFLQIFAPVGVLAMVLYSFYGALPKQILKSIEKQSLLSQEGLMKAVKFNIPENKVQRAPPSAVGKVTAAKTGKPVWTEAKINGTTQRVLIEGGTITKIADDGKQQQKLALNMGNLQKAAAAGSKPPQHHLMSLVSSSATPSEFGTVAGSVSSSKEKNVNTWAKNVAASVARQQLASGKPTPRVPTGSSTNGTARSDASKPASAAPKASAINGNKAATASKATPVKSLAKTPGSTPAPKAAISAAKGVSLAKPVAMKPVSAQIPPMKKAPAAASAPKLNGVKQNTATTAKTKSTPTTGQTKKPLQKASPTSTNTKKPSDASSKPINKVAKLPAK